MATKTSTIKTASSRAKTSTSASAKTTTSKKKATPKAAQKKPAPKRKGAVKSGKATTIKAHVDVGWGNRLFIRGSGGGLQWESGQAMDWAKDGWTWSTPASSTESIEFKFLINDEVWAEGENIAIASGESYTSTPQF